MRNASSKDTPQPTLNAGLRPVRFRRIVGLAGLVIVAAVGAQFLAPGKAWAQDGMSSEDDDGWSFRLTPYIWLPTISGGAQVDSGEPPVDIDASFLDVLDFAFLIAGEARKDRWGILGEFIYLSLSESASTDGVLYLGADAGLKGSMGSLFAAYRTYEGADSSIDILAGARAWWLDVEIDYQAGTLPAQSVEKSSNWVDPVIGLRGQVMATDKIILTGLADIGGFGVGTDLQWEVLASVGYQFNQMVSASIGYRHLDIDLKDGSLVADVSLSGPYLSVSFDF